MRRAKKLLSFGATILLLASLLLPLIPPVKAHADPGVPGQDRLVAIPITTCQGLRDINNDLTATYALSNNLNCTGSGFISIGKDDNGLTFGSFSGRFYGQGHSISNLNTPLFDDIAYGIVANLSLSGSLNISDTSPTGFLAHSVNFGGVSDIRVTGSISLSHANSWGGGLSGSLNQANIVRSSAVVSVQVAAAQVLYGGLAAVLGGSRVQDSYATTTMVISSGGVEHAGGLGAYADATQIINSYASGSINNPAQVHEIGGLAWQGTSGLTVTNSFSTFQGSGLCNGTNGCSGLVTVIDSGLDLSTGYFDQTAAGTNRCNGDGSNTTCNRVNTDGSQGAYFNNNSTNGPFVNWDFTNVWQTTAGLPTLRSFSDPSPQPDPVEQLTASIDASTSIKLNWSLPANTGSAPFLGEEVYYKKVGDISWSRATQQIINFTSTDVNFIATSLVVSNLEPGSSYNFEVALYNSEGYFSTNTVAGVTATPGFSVINTCEQLQDITDNLVDNFELGRNIDCSDSVNWNAGRGFTPIGCNMGQADFMGVFKGNNYTISNISVRGSDNCYNKAIFGSTRNALVQDVNIIHPTIMGSSGNNYGNAILVGNENGGSTFTNIHVQMDIVGDDNLVAAGLINGTGGSLPTTISRVSVVASVTGDLNTIGAFGGLVGSKNSLVSINDSYVQIDIEATTSSGYGYYLGGLIGNSLGNVDGRTQITNSYAALNYDATNTTLNDGGYVMTGGLMGVASESPTVTNSFALTKVIGPVGDRSNFGGLVGFISGGGPPADLSGNYFDGDLIETNKCAGQLPEPDTAYSRAAICTSITGQPNYFYNNSTNSPLNNWDFDNVWATTSTLPVFGSKVLTTVTPIPASRLVSKKPTTTAKATIPAKPPMPATIIAERKAAAAQASAAEQPPAATGVIAELKRLISYVPAVVLVNFPYFLFGLLLLTALALLVEMIRQTNHLKKLNLLLARQRSVAEKRDTFWHLAANYLRAPVTLLMGGTDLLALNKVDNVETRQLMTLSARLQTKVAGIMQKIEHSHTLRGIKPPKAERPHRVWRSVGFWLPVATVAILITLTNYVAQSWRNINISTIALASQALLFLLIALALYWVLGAFGVVSRRRRNAERLLQQQSAALDEARLHLMRQTATELDADVNHLQSVLAKLSVPSDAKPIMQEGASRLRHLVDSFSLLISAQNHRLGGLSPVGAHTSLDRALKDSLAELEAKMVAKDIKFDLPAKQGLRVPGSRELNNQVLSSVLANAVAFSPSGSTIRLAVEQTETGVSLRIADQGPGITPVQQAHLFEPFTKADGLTGLQLDHGGLGINLYLDRQIMDHLGGGIAVHSVVGQGTVVELNWPPANKSSAHYPGMLVHPGPSAV